MKKLIALLLAVCMLLGLMTTAFAADEKSNDIVILHTNDVHCGVSDGLGYAGVAAYKAEMEQTHNFVTLVDCGDAIQGEPIGLLPLLLWDWSAKGCPEFRLHPHRHRAGHLIVLRLRNQSPNRLVLLTAGTGGQHGPAALI